jgi:hypothetical protein
LIGLSLLPTGHPPSFQPRWVRPSTGSYPRFSLPMGSSPGFASAQRDSTPCSDSLSLRLGHPLTSPRGATRWLILQKARRHTNRGAPTACRQAVSGTVSLPSRGAFHLSLAVLVRYRSQESIQGWRVDPPDSHRVSRARRYSGADCRGDPIRVRGSNPVPPAFPGRSASVRLCNRTIVGPTTPGGTCPPRFALGPLSLATTRGISI